MNPLCYDPVIGLMIGLLTIAAMGFAAYGGVKLMDRFARCDSCGERGGRSTCATCYEHHWGELP